MNQIAIIGSTTSGDPINNLHYWQCQKLLNTSRNTAGACTHCRPIFPISGLTPQLHCVYVLVLVFPLVLYLQCLRLFCLCSEDDDFKTEFLYMFLLRSENIVKILVRYRETIRDRFFGLLSVGRFPCHTRELFYPLGPSQTLRSYVFVYTKQH